MVETAILVISVMICATLPLLLLNRTGAPETNFRLRNIRHLDSLRGIAVTQIVLSTYLSAFYPTAQVQPLFETTAVSNIVLAILTDGYTGICLCLAVSGFTLTRAYEFSAAPLGRILLGRACRLALPAIAAVALGAAVAALLREIVPDTAWSVSPWLASLLPPNPSPSAIGRDIATAFFIGYNGTSTAADLISAYSVVLLPNASSLHMAFPLGNAFNPALWSLCLQTLGSLIVIILIRARHISRLLSVTLAGAAFACLATTPLAAMLAGHAAARWGSSREANMPVAVALLITVLGFTLCLVPIAEIPPAAAAFCAGPYLNLTACGDPAHLVKIVGAALLFLMTTWTQGVQRGLSALPFGLVGRLAPPIYLAHVPVIVGVGALTLPVPNLAGSPGGALFLAAVSIAALGGAVTVLRPINAAALRVGHALATGQPTARPRWSPRRGSG